MIITILQIIVAIGLIVTVLLQMQGSGLTTTFGGGSGEFYRGRRSLEKALVIATILLAILFAVLSIVLLFPH